MFLVNFFSSEGMDQFPDQYLFKWPHFIYLAACVLLFWFLMKGINNQNPKVQKIVIQISCILLLVFKYGGEAIFIYEWENFGDAISSFSHPFWDWRTLISFQVCGITNVLMPFVIWFNIKPLKEFVFPAGIIGGITVLLYPVGVLFGDPITITFPLLRTLIVHFLLVFLPCYLIKIGEFKLEKKYWYRSLIGSLLIIAWALIGNLWIDPGENYMFLMFNPFGGGPIPVLNAIPDGWHLLLTCTAVFLGFWAVYYVAGKYRQKEKKIIK